MSGMMGRRLSSGWAALAGLTLVACGAAKPTTELKSAEAAFDEAKQSPAQQLAPARLHDAEVALSRARQAFEDDPGSLQERSFSVVAHRRAERAAAIGQARRYDGMASDASKKLAELQEQHRRQLKANLEDTREKMDALERDLAQRRQQGEELGEKAQRLEERRQELERELRQQEQALAEAKQARREAEARAEAAMKKVEKFAQIAEEQKKVTITLSGAVLFRTDKAELLPRAKEKLRNVADVLRSNDNAGKELVIEGHTDSRGTKQYNQKLSQQRADAVRNYLVSAGVDPNRIDTIGKGESEPVASNQTPEGRANNRRVEIVIDRTT